MSLRNVQNNLPSGFHDSQLIGLSLDLKSKTLILDIMVLVSDTSAKENIYRHGILTIKHLHYLLYDQECFLNLKNLSEDGLRIDIDDDYSSAPKPKQWASGNENSGWIFLHAQNSFIHFSGKEVIFRWNV